LLASAAAGYVIGSLPSADLACRLAGGNAGDLRRAGTGNPGAVNAMAVLGKGWGWAVLLADVAKGVLACTAGRRVGGARGSSAAGTAAVVGQCFPVWKRFRGGRGVAVSVGQCLATLPAYVPVDLAVAYGVGKWRRRTFPATAVASGAWVAAAFLWWRRGWPNAWGPVPGPELPVAAAATTAVIVVRFLMNPIPPAAPPAPPAPS
jgi:glycerol-3-phosphate acyltransferase PlsY